MSKKGKRRTRNIKRRTRNNISKRKKRKLFKNRTLRKKRKSLSKKSKKLKKNTKRKIQSGGNQEIIEDQALFNPRDFRRVLDIFSEISFVTAAGILVSIANFALSITNRIANDQKDKFRLVFEKDKLIVQFDNKKTWKDFEITIIANIQCGEGDLSKEEKVLIDLPSTTVDNLLLDTNTLSYIKGKGDLSIKVVLKKEGDESQRSLYLRFTFQYNSGKTKTEEIILFNFKIPKCSSSRWRAPWKTYGEATAAPTDTSVEVK